MKKFAFRLAGFLRIKEFEEKNAWNEVLKQESRTLNLKNKIDNLNMALKRNTQDMSEIGGQDKPFQTARAAWSEDAVQGIQARIVQLDRELQNELRILEKLTARHQEIKKEAKVLDNFRERKKADHHVEQNKHSQKQTNEFAGQSYARKVSSDE